MKPTLAKIIIALAMLFSPGCASDGSFPDREQRCGHYSNVYALYIASTAVRPIAKEEAAAALAATIFLRTYCGWTGTKAVDVNGVPVIQPPNER